MKRRAAVVGALILCFVLGALLSDRIGLPGLEGREEDRSALELPAAVAKSWFPPIHDYDTGGEPLDEERFEGLMKALDDAMRAEETLNDFRREANLHIWNFIRRIAIAEVTEEQTEKIEAYIEELSERHPEHESMLRGQRDKFDAFGEASPAVPSFSLLIPLSGGSDPDGEFFDDDQLDRLIDDLDALLNAPETLGDFANEAQIYFLHFRSHLQKGRIGPEQTDKILAYFDNVGEKHPEAAELIVEQRLMVQRLLPGRVAPNIVGTDTEGLDFELEDYRGDIVVLIFSGQWCAPCREEYPYQRAMMALYEDEDVVLLGVNSDAKLETVQEAKKTERLGYRTWWDGHGQEDEDNPAATEGPIATEWNVIGWPDIYILDWDGVIRHVGKRGVAIIVAVEKLLLEKRRLDSEAAAAAREEEGEEAPTAGGAAKLQPTASADDG